MLKNAPNQADNIMIYQSCLLLKMKLSVVLEGRNTGYEYLITFPKHNSLRAMSWGFIRGNNVALPRNLLSTPLFHVCVLFLMQNLVMYLRLSNTCQMSVLLTYLIIKNGTFIRILWRNVVLDHIMYCGSSDLFCVLHF